MSDFKAKMNKIPFPPHPLAVFKGKLKTAVPFLFAHPVNRLYSLCNFRWFRNLQEFGKICCSTDCIHKIASPLWFVPHTSIHQVSSPDLGPSPVPYHFYRAILCIRGTSHGSVSVCLSVTSRFSTKTAKRRITQTTPHDTPGTLVF